MRMIHPTAVIADGANIGENVKIGPYCVIGEHVSLGDDSELMSHVVIGGRTSIGKGNRFFPFAAIGMEPQDLKFHGEPSTVQIGDNNTFRENVTVNCGTEGGGMNTSLGNNNLLMAYVHIAHDCHVGNEVVMANCATLAGHITINDGAIIGGMSAIHQFVRIGRFSMIGGMSGITKDIPPFCLTAGGYRPGLVGLNIVGLKRRKFSLEDIARLKKAYRILLQGTDKMADKISRAEQELDDAPVTRELLDFVRQAERGLVMHRRDDNDE
ncbi:MAG: acyl-[acyl-carrier-protein]--UDP-N-acetylglucosamine O-acyltransferase [Zetaproteobacteria bacterium CG12_big_fil_rev_8_21_14_0_65_55_1124]|nr:MAG: acyl-[acyl-carrier-protein]--UDP-N-acetylglucosamine O-acyltransferase [Zetaproteobacteria bacterium CG1_02_55_237]PIS19889.1 MAG: acyl-[acyl-carrier-protein]--UDP-N-acetylglucosamine O-acyltransferase [Zetaproteobacteria bacterium CG08_land_8_20_14_0_20_55_17]PIW42551.1 MAG: acyl-[acyl-carrier-protein]--UDP-N-acetylglucosamine O-acyltransferase [Zetaproteobacteria bacterium CG12_big_fil_rev_8_21_14_0_65_55_1124]PIY51298.1 MAG: acyl-[acyl-carrier-protein]--UDP-N-acetylglucosamine O-acylt